MGTSEVSVMISNCIGKEKEGKEYNRDIFYCVDGPSQITVLDVKVNKVYY
jgi:hypothetical protein